MSDKPCPRDHAALTTKHCPDCGEPKVQPVPDDPLEAFCVDLLMKAVGRYMPATARDVAAKARELLAPKLPSAEELAGLIHQELDHFTGGLIPTSKRIAERILSFLSSPPAQPEPKAEPPAPATSAETEAVSTGAPMWIWGKLGMEPPHDGVDEVRWMKESDVRADLARATKGLRERETQWVELANERLRALDAAVERAERAERERDGQKAENEKLRAEVAQADRLLVAECLARVHAERDRDQYREDLERTKADLAALRASQPAGLPKIGEPVEVLAGSVWIAGKVSMHWTCYPESFNVTTAEGSNFCRQIGDHGKTWRRLPTGEKGRG